MVVVACGLFFASQRLLRFGSPGMGKLTQPGIDSSFQNVAWTGPDSSDRFRNGYRPIGDGIGDMQRVGRKKRGSGGRGLPSIDMDCGVLDASMQEEEDGEQEVPQLRWTHIPKTGQSFAYTVIRHGCPLVNLQKMHGLVDKYRDNELKHGVTDPSLNSFMQRVLQGRGCRERAGTEGVCPHLKMPLRGHVPIQPSFYGQYVTMLREPHQRLISAAHMGTGCNKGLRDMNFTECLAFKFKTERGCYTRFLNGELCSLDMVDQVRCRGGAMDKCVVSATKAILNGAVRFTGITEWWDASICLFHAISGGIPHDTQFKNIHPGRGASTKKEGRYDVSLLRGRIDSHDLFIYEKAKERFREQWERYRDEMPMHPTCQTLAKLPTVTSAAAGSSPTASGADVGASAPAARGQKSKATPKVHDVRPPMFSRGWAGSPFSS